MNLVNGLLLKCPIASFGAIALVGFALWIRSNDENSEPSLGNKPYSLADLIAQCDLKSPPPKDMDVWS